MSAPDWTPDELRERAAVLRQTGERLRVKWARRKTPSWEDIYIASSAYDGYADALEALSASRAEIARLRAALEAVDRYNDHPGRFSHELDGIVHDALSASPATGERDARQALGPRQRSVLMALDEAKWRRDWMLDIQGLRPGDVENYPREVNKACRSLRALGLVERTVHRAAPGWRLTPEGAQLKASYALSQHDGETS